MLNLKILKKLRYLLINKRIINKNGFGNIRSRSWFCRGQGKRL